MSNQTRVSHPNSGKTMEQLLGEFRGLTRQDQIAFSKMAAGHCGMVAIYPNQMGTESPRNPKETRRPAEKKVSSKQEIKNPLHDHPIYDRFKAAKKLYVEAKKAGDVPMHVQQELEWCKSTYFRLLTETKKSGSEPDGKVHPSGVPEADNDKVDSAAARDYKTYKELLPALWEGHRDAGNAALTAPPKSLEAPKDDAKTTSGGSKKSKKPKEETLDFHDMLDKVHATRA